MERKNEIAAKKAKLAELRRLREEREQRHKTVPRGGAAGDEIPEVCIAQRTCAGTLTLIPEASSSHCDAWKGSARHRSRH